MIKKLYQDSLWLAGYWNPTSPDYRPGDLTWQCSSSFTTGVSDTVQSLRYISYTQCFTCFHCIRIQQSGWRALFMWWHSVPKQEFWAWNLYTYHYKQNTGGACNNDRSSAVDTMAWKSACINPLKPELNPICYLLALLVHHFLHVNRIRVKLLTIRLLMSYIYGTPILDVSRSHTTTQHSR